MDCFADRRAVTRLCDGYRACHQHLASNDANKRTDTYFRAENYRDFSYGSHPRPVDVTRHDGVYEPGVFYGEPRNPLKRDVTRW